MQYIKTIGNLNTISVVNFRYCFSTCSCLTSIGEMDGSSALEIRNMFDSCSKLVNFGGFKNLGMNYSTTASANNSAYTLTLSSCSNLTHDSLMNIINGLYDIASKGCNVQKLVLGTTNLAKLSDEEKAIATNKGWALS